MVAFLTDMVIVYAALFVLAPIWILGRFLFRRSIAILFRMPRYESGGIGAKKSWWA